MPITYDHTNVRYSERDAQCVMDIKDTGLTVPPGSTKCAVIRFEGGGMTRTDKRLIEDTGQFEFFTNGSGTGWADGYDPAADEIVVFSCNYMLHRYNVSGTADDKEDFDGDTFSLRYQSNPGYLEQWVLCALDAIDFVKRNANTYGVDPNKIVLSGSSAGGLAMACAAYMTAPGYSVRADAFDSKPFIRTLSSDVAGIIIHDSPLDLSRQTGGVYNAFLFGAVGPGDVDPPALLPWTADMRERTRRVSALEIMEDNLRMPHVFSWYQQPYDSTDDLSGDVTSLAHSPSWGVEHHNRIVARWPDSDGSGSDDEVGVRPAHKLIVGGDTYGDFAADTNNGTFAEIDDSGDWPMAQLRQWMFERGWTGEPN